MKSRNLLLLFMIMIYSMLAGRDTRDTTDYQKQVKTLDSTIKTLYGVISGDAGIKRDWDLFRYLFVPEAKLIPSGKGPSGVESTFLTIDEYIKRSGAWLEKYGFYEREISRKTDRFGSMAHVFSTYASYKEAGDKEPFARGINSIQLKYDGDRWWILNIYWLAETEKVRIPKAYLAGPEKEE